MRINKYLALNKYSTRKGADELIERGEVLINGRKAQLGEKVNEGDTVEVKSAKRKYRYFAYYKPRGVITHSPQGEETDIAMSIPLQGVFPVGRLDKDSYGLIILTDDGRITEPLLSPESDHDKEYEVTTKDDLPKDFKHKMERGVYIGDEKTKPCVVKILAPNKFSITLTEGKKHQIRRMLGVFGQSAVELKRVRVMNIKLKSLGSGEYREISGTELTEFLAQLKL